MPIVFGILMLLGGCGALALAVFGHARGGGEAPWCVWLFPWPFLAAGAGMLVHRWLATKEACRSAPGEDGLGRITLAGGTRRGSKAVLVAAGAIAMNCLAWTFADIAWQEWSKGRFSWILVLVSAGAVVAGAGVAWHALQGIVGCFAPAFDLTLTGSPQEGGGTSFLWHRRGRDWSVASLTFELVGVRTIRVRRSMREETVTDWVHRETLAFITEPGESSPAPIPVVLPSVTIEEGARVEWEIQSTARYHRGFKVADCVTIPLRALERNDLPPCDLPERREGVSA